jgi:NADP-dependent 3-hydroxy acid dehydrogenase YdfG
LSRDQNARAVLAELTKLDDAGRVPRAIVTLAPRPSTFEHRPPLAPQRTVAVAIAGARGRGALAAIERALSAAGIASLAVVEVPDDGAAPAESLLPADLGALIDLRALDAPLDVDGALAAAKASLFIVQAARASLASSAAAGGAFYFVATALASTSPASSAVHGLVKTAALEWPSVACSVVDCAHTGDVDGDGFGAIIAQELFAGFRDVEVVRNRDGRFVPAVVERMIDREYDDASTALDSGDVVVASGGARGVTATTLRALAAASRCSCVLLGRTPLTDEPACCTDALDEAALKRALVGDAKARGAPIALAAIGEQAKSILAVREIRAFVDELEALGARVLYRAVDVRDRAAVARVCEEGRAAFGPITAVVHGAGVLADKRIEDKTREQVDRVMDTKVLGLRSLLEATTDDPVSIVALFSSVAGRFGNVGQVDYAMANEALNEMAVDVAKKRPGVVVKSFNWGPWEGGMVTPALKKLFEERGVRVLAHADGARHFLDELGANDGVVEVVFGGALDGTSPTSSSSTSSSSTSLHLPAPAASSATFVHLDAAAFPFFADHALQGTVVLPAVGAVALLAEAAKTTSFADVRVLRGVQLPQFFRAGHDAVARVDDDGRCTLALADDAAPRYAARAVAAAPVDDAALRASFLEAARGLASFRYASRPIYGADDALLFHGPRFHMIESVEAAGDAGLVARVHGSLARGWGENLAVDVGALDAALQAVLLWGRQRTGGAYLPTSIARLTSLLGPRHAALRCIVRGLVCDELKARADVLLVDESDGAIVALLEGVELHRVSDEAFRTITPSSASETISSPPMPPISGSAV